MASTLWAIAVAALPTCRSHGTLPCMDTRIDVDSEGATRGVAQR